MSVRRVVVDNSALMPAFFPEPTSRLFDAKLVTNRALSLMQAIRLKEVVAYVPPSFYREFLNNVAVLLNERMSVTQRLALREDLVQHWNALLDLPLVTIDVRDIVWRAGDLSLREDCPSADSWYVAAAEHAKAKFWMSHRHRDGLHAIASKFVQVGLLSEDSPAA